MKKRFETEKVKPMGKNKATPALQPAWGVSYILACPYKEGPCLSSGSPPAQSSLNFFSCLGLCSSTDETLGNISPDAYTPLCSDESFSFLSGTIAGKRAHCRKTHNPRPLFIFCKELQGIEWDGLISCRNFLPQKRLASYTLSYGQERGWPQRQRSRWADIQPVLSTFGANALSKRTVKDSLVILPANPKESWPAFGILGRPIYDRKSPLQLDFYLSKLSLEGRKHNG
jgi:hypothetical protein